MWRGHVSHNQGVMGYWPEDQRWNYGFPSFHGWNVGSKAELDALFGEGVYTVHVLGSVINLDLNGDLYPALPTVAITGGVWRDGVYAVSTGTAIQITTNEFVEWGTTAAEAMSVNLDGSGYEDGVGRIRLPGDDPGPPPVLTLTVPAGALAPGEQYRVDIEFSASSDAITDVPGLPDAIAVAAFSVQTRVLIQIGPACVADFNSDGLLDLADILAFVTAFGNLDPAADLAEPFGLFDLADVLAFVVAFNAGCP